MDDGTVKCFNCTLELIAEMKNARLTVMKRKGKANASMAPACNAHWTGKGCQHKACPNNCWDHGHCKEGKCICDKGYKGKLCSIRYVEHGECDIKSVNVNAIPEKSIAAFEGQMWTGDDCATKSCPDDCSSKAPAWKARASEEGWTGPNCAVTACDKNVASMVVQRTTENVNGSRISRP